MILHEKVSIIVAGGKDRYGNPLPPVEQGPYMARVDPVSSSEAVAHGTFLVAYYHLIVGLPAGVQLKATSQVKWRGRTFAVQGDVETWAAGGRVHHYEATLKGT